MGFISSFKIYSLICIWLSTWKEYVVVVVVEQEEEKGEGGKKDTGLS